MYQEKVRAPWWVWALAVLAAVSIGLAIGAAFGNYSDLVAATATLLAIGYGLIRSTIHITVDHDFLRVNDAALPLRFVGEVTALNPAQARQVRGPLADPSAYMVLRGWISTAVTVVITDTDDPVPYWFISTNKPKELLAALKR